MGANIGNVYTLLIENLVNQHSINGKITKMDS